MIVMIYNPGVYKEYLLPNIMDADYTIRLEKGIFPITEDVRENIRENIEIREQKTIDDL